VFAEVVVFGAVMSRHMYFISIAITMYTTPVALCIAHELLFLSVRYNLNQAVGGCGFGTESGQRLAATCVSWWVFAGVSFLALALLSHAYMQARFDVECEIRRLKLIEQAAGLGHRFKVCVG
jgi:hypothetical protein